MFSYDQEKWNLEEKIRLLELFIDKDSGLWEDRANALQEEFGGKRPTDFFTQTTVKRELNNIFNKPNPEHHIFGMPTHPRGKEAAELWLKHFRRELEEGRERRKQMFMVAMRKQLDIIRRYQQGKLPKEELDALLEEARQRDAQRPDKEQYEEKIKQHMAKAYFEDVKNVRTFADYFRFLRGVRIPTPARSPTPIKVFDESCPEIMDSFQDAKQVIKPVAGPAEATDISTKQQRMPRMQVAATPPTEKPKTRKRKHELSDETDAELEKPNAKRLRTTSKTITDAKQVIKPVAGPAEATDISTKQQRMPRMQVAATPPTEKPKTRKRKADLSFDGMRETDAESEKGQSEKRARNFIRKESVDDKSVSSSALSSPQSFVVTPPQPLISEVAATAKLRSQLRRAAIASSTPSPAVDSVADNRLFLKPGKRSSTAVLPKQILLTLWRDIHSHRYAPVFSFPVSEELVHGYHTAIKKPMDLKTLKTNIESGEVNTLGKFSYAILKMFANAVMYNSTGHYVNNYAKEMVAYALKCIEVVQFPTGQFHAPPPSRQSNGSSSEGGAIGGGGAAKFTIAWATTLIKPKGVDQKKAKGRNDEELTSSSSQEAKEREADQRDEEETRRLFQRRRMYNKKYTFTSTI
ncbi:hypothetical protein niasHS_014611 [Heterodera schachtii]|uniref:Bromo domain-containing protein n=1 Tax=Heterodera schachtii TaxID=97005 RepID=A0ABD2IF38_HETSC